MTAILTKTRDSVCAGDDADAPHTRRLEIDNAVNDTVEFVGLACRGYLASVNSSGHSWTAILNGTPIATIKPTAILPFVEHIELIAENTLYFKYHSATF